ncbi:diguanylate cyclase (GGDEF) domain-containing protein [Balnearium lithotrophicum]|uniref:diguanylate cyclase n=1 Tax=Balnearium lithotrophicum TaxID=223788 RepID=A0A521CFQ1_9BACT|nr:diguanylate cyclase [Balnearium lithotrophicum]SMO58264.1 diguanylate cyclase (GGDEF) domain-containing protein [Balnearium lithotrophicum]
MDIDLSQPFELAEDVFWVGYYVPNDPFQCHVYLIRNGEESILIDPGSMITFPVVLEKIFKLTTLRNIKYIIMHHQDPDITGCYHTLESLFPKNQQRFIVTHWRTKVLLKHYMWKTPFYLIDKQDWKLKAGDRELEFIFTPYAHFPGAFCTFDKKTKVLFSSDIFGAISDKFFLFAVDDEEYYKGVELFHKHYMPSRHILNYALDRITEKNPEVIAPQHGSIIKKDMIDRVVKRLRDLDCGLYLLDEKVSDIGLLQKLDEKLKTLFKKILSSSEFADILRFLFLTLKEEIPVERIVVVSERLKNGKFLKIEITEDSINEKTLKELNLSELEKGEGFSWEEALETDKKIGRLIFIFKNKELSQFEREFLRLLIKHVKYPLAASFERKITFELLEEEKELLLKKAITDPLTKLYNRNYLFSYLEEMIPKSKEHGFPISLAVIDIDFFKRINDTYGHLIGDCVLKELSSILSHSFRANDCVARYGGEEFVVVMPFSTLHDACKKLEKVREQIKEHVFCKSENRSLKVTVSVGVTEYRDSMSIEEFIKRADENLYEAKRSGRDRVICK